MSKKTKTNLLYVVVVIGLLSCVAFSFYLYQVDDSAKQVVKDYWSLMLENKPEEANNLTSFSGKGGEWMTKEKQPSTQVVSADGKNRCCFQDVIYSNQIKLDEIKETQVFREMVGEEYTIHDNKGNKSGYIIKPTIGMVVATTDNRNQKNDLAVCLGESLLDNKWKIRKITFLEDAKLKDICRSY